MLEQYSKRMPADTQFYPLKMSGLRTFMWVLVVAAVYFGIAGLSLFFAFEHTAISPLWPPAGIALAAVLLLGYPVCAGIFIGALASNVFTLNMAASPIGPLLVAAFSTAV
jgi:integral membrane sensor domain MASE1